MNPFTTMCDRLVYALLASRNATLRMISMAVEIY